MSPSPNCERPAFCRAFFGLLAAVLAFAAGGGPAASASAGAATQATVHGAVQLPRTEIVEIDYALTAPDAGPWEVALFFATSANGSWTRAAHAFGDVGPDVFTGAARTVHWAAGLELPANFSGTVFLHLEAARPVSDAAVQARDPLGGAKMPVDLRRFADAPHYFGFAGSELHDLQPQEDGWLGVSFFGLPPYRYAIEGSNDLQSWTPVSARLAGAGDEPEVAPAAPSIVRLGVPLPAYRFFRLVIRRAAAQATWPPAWAAPSPAEPPIMNPPDIQPGPSLRTAGVHTFSLIGAATATWSVDRLVRAEQAKTGGFTRTTDVFAAQNGASATFSLGHVAGHETRYEIRATLPGGAVRTATVQVFPAGQRASFMFDSAAGKRVLVYVVVPPSLAPATTKAVSIHHGLSRNGDDYCDFWRDWAVANDTIAFAPTFDAEDWPGSSVYNQGNVLSGTALREESQWTFTIVQRIIEHVLEGFGLATRLADVWGHSAGGQFVHRMALFRPEAPVRFWMAANPGIWSLADLQGDWQHGLAHPAFGFTAPDVTRWSEQRLLVFRGSSDIHRDSNLDTSAASDLQGRSRYARAGTAFARMRLHDAATNWRLLEAPFVGHSGQVMAQHAQAFLAAQPWENAGPPRTLALTVEGGGVVHYPREQTFRDGAVVTLQAVPEEGFEFAGWSGALTGTANPAQLTVDGDAAVAASFVPTTRRVIYWTGFDRLSGFPGNWQADSGWSLSTDNPSSGYAGPTHLTGASAARNALITRGGDGTHNLTLGPVNTVGYTSIRVSWGARRSPSFTGKVTFQWSANGTTWNTISSWSDVENDSVWRRVAEFALPAGAAGVPALRLRWQWTQSGVSTGTYRFDDPVITGVTAAPTTLLHAETFGSGDALPAGWTTSGSGWSLQTTLASAGYGGASGGAHLCAANLAGGAAASVTAAPISTAGYRQVKVSWAARRTLDFFNPIRFQWSGDGATWNDVAYREVAADVSWQLVNDRVAIELPVAAWNVPALRLRWSFTPMANDGTYRLDDLRVHGVAVPGSAGE